MAGRRLPHTAARPPGCERRGNGLRACRSPTRRPPAPGASRTRQLGGLRGAAASPPWRRLWAARTPPPPTPAPRRAWPRPQTGRG
eukprot:9354520-Alexandrium_andersonii.AAC.1